MSDTKELVPLLPEERKAAEDAMRTAVGNAVWRRWRVEERVRAEERLSRAMSESRKAGRMEVLDWMQARSGEVEEVLVVGAWLHVLGAVTTKFNRKRAR